MGLRFYDDSLHDGLLNPDETARSSQPLAQSEKLQSHLIWLC
jgi:hypothetical protein